MTGTEPRHRDWIKLWIKESLLGTIREDLEPEERSTWYDFLLLAGNCRLPGVISANENTAIPNKRIAAILNVEESLVKRCIVKFEKSGRITVEKSGVIHITNWEKYQYSDYDRVKKYRQQQKEPSAGPPDSLDHYIEELRPQYPGLDFDAELVKFNLYWGEGDRKLKRPKLALLNWMNKAKEIKKDGANRKDTKKGIPGNRPAGAFDDLEKGK